MTNKQIIIDGVDVSECKEFENEDQEMCCNLLCGYGACKLLPDCYYKQLERLKEHHHKTECEASENLKKLVELEQECEELKVINQELMKYRKHSTTCQECYEDGLEDGKTSNKELRKLKQTLAEIKEIAESEMDSKEFMTVQYMLNGSVDNKNKVLKQILQKINEVENGNI